MDETSVIPSAPDMPTGGVLAVLGAGGHARVVADAAERAGWDRVVVFDDLFGQRQCDWAEIIGDSSMLIDRVQEFDGVIVGIGANAARLENHRRLKAAGACMARVIHPAAIISRFATVGAGSVVFAGGVVNPGARLGEAVIVNTAATVDHDDILADGVHISPGAHLAGGVSVGERAWVGIGAVVREGLSIGGDVVIGAGAVLVKHAPDGAILIGNPAQPIR